MSSETSMVAEGFRLQEWAVQIRECQNRPAGMSVASWCADKGITKANYYYRLRRVREACLGQFQHTATTFVELPVPDNKTVTPDDVPVSDTPVGMSPVIRIKNIRGLSAEIFPTAPPEILHHLIEAFSHVE